jgi:hypothetical protein
MNKRTTGRRATTARSLIHITGTRANAERASEQMTVTWVNGRRAGEHATVSWANSGRASEQVIEQGGRHATLFHLVKSLMAKRPHNPYIRCWDPRTGEIYYEHRAVAEWKLGRKLRPGEVAHHEDGDRENNHPDNIRVLPSQRHHAFLEHYRRREAKGIQHLFDVEELLELL